MRPLTGAPGIGFPLQSCSRTGSDTGLLTISVSARAACTLVNLAGEADMTVCGQLRDALTAQVLAGTPRLVIGLAELRYIDSSCVQVLVGANRMAGEAGGALSLVAPRPIVARMMDVWGVGRLITIYGSLAEAAG